MKKLFRIAAAVLCMVMFLGAFSMIAAAEGTDEIDARIVSADTQVYGGGIFDIYAASSTPNATFQWVSRSEPDVAEVLITNGDAYKGTNTDHLQILTLDELAGNTPQFACRGGSI